MTSTTLTDLSWGNLQLRIKNYFDSTLILQPYKKQDYLNLVLSLKRITSFSGRKKNRQKKENGVAFMVRNSILNYVIPPFEGSEQMIELKLHTNLGIVKLINVYAPTMQSLIEIIGNFYNQQCQAVKFYPKSILQSLVILTHMLVQITLCGPFT